MSDPPSLSRRRILGATGLAATATGGYLAGVRTDDAVPDWLAGHECSPSSIATSETDWPFFRHDRANTGNAPGRAGPDPPLRQVWESEWPVASVRVVVSLVAADGVLVALPDSEPGVLAAFTLDDGSLRWRRPVNDSRYGHLAAAGGKLFVEADIPDTDGSFAVRSLADGTALWTDSFISHVPQTLAGGRLVVFDREPDESREERHFAATAIDARTGVECWRTVHAGWPFDVGVADGRVVVANREGGVVALDPATGRQQWRSDAGGDRLAVVDGRALVALFPGELRALSLADGSTEWEIRSSHYQPGGTDAEGREYARPEFELGAVTSNAVVYTLGVHSEYPERVQARDPATGELLWDVGPDPRPVDYHGYSWPIAVGDDVLVVRSARREGTDDIPDALLRLDAATGAERGRVTFGPDEDVFRPVVADGYLVVPTDERVVAFA